MQRDTGLPEIIIRSEADAYDILQKALDNSIGEYGSVRFDGWPCFSLYVKGQKFDQSITPTIMKGLLELQKNIYRSYASAKSDSSTYHLTHEEKKQLEIKVSVKGGSSSFEINFQDIAIKLIEQLGARMNPTEALVTVVAIATLYFGNSAYRSFLQNRKEIREKEITDDTQRKTLETLQFTSDQETKRVQLITALAKKDSTIHEITQQANEAHTEIVKCLSAGTTSELDGIPLTPMISEMLIHNAKRKSNEVRLDGMYRLLKLDWSDPCRFRVKIFNTETGLNLDADVQDESLTGKYKEALKSAEWSRKPVKLNINAKLIGENTYRDAVIVSAELVQEPSEQDPHDESIL